MKVWAVSYVFGGERRKPWQFETRQEAEAFLKTVEMSKRWGTDIWVVRTMYVMGSRTEKGGFRHKIDMSKPAFQEPTVVRWQFKKLEQAEELFKSFTLEPTEEMMPKEVGA